MAKGKDNYRQYFDIDEFYFPCIDDGAINAGAPWGNTYPHETFIQLLNDVERMLGGAVRRSIWIHGAYGTGKSQCAYALRKILQISEAELRNYWNKYEPLRRREELLNKLLGHKERKIVVAHRYASGTIREPRALFIAIQEAIKNAFDEQQIDYKGESILRESVVLWIEDPVRKEFLTALLKKPEYSALFSQSTADEIITALRKDENAEQLIHNIFRLADKEGIRAFDLDAVTLKTWIKDIINKNNIKIVLIWDEFSDYFRNNRNSLGEFQNIVSLCQETPFYFIIVTHQTSSIINNTDQSWAVVQQRFNFSEITLPDNIAFNLISHAFDVKQAAKNKWNLLADDLNSRLAESRSAVIKEAKINDQNVMKMIMPIHPMAALILKNIASAFQSNQRSMFDFIKTANTEDVKSFQWFIENYGPMDDYPLLTINYLWNFFYEKGRNNLTSDIQIILDTYPRQQDLNRKQEEVLKTILIMQAIDQRLNGAVELIKATERNLAYTFEGISDLEGSACVNIAKDLVGRGILYNKPIGGGQTAFAVAMLSGDQTKIDKIKEKLRADITTSRIVTEGQLATVLMLNAALRIRFESEPGTGKLTAVTHADFIRTINGMKEKPFCWKFQAVICFAKDENEAIGFRKAIKGAVANKDYENIVFIDALSTPFGEDMLEQYIDYTAMAEYYVSSERELSRDNDTKAKRLLNIDWRNQINNGQFIVYWFKKSNGERCPNTQGVLAILQDIVLKNYPYVFDFEKNLTENQLKLTNGKTSALYGITGTGTGPIKGIEKTVLSSVWGVDRYWVSAPTLSISKMKNDIEKVVEKAFEQAGNISIRELYLILEEKYGFAPSNLSAFIAGFLLKEYANDPYRASDSMGSTESMRPDKMAEMLGNYIGNTALNKYKDTYIVKMTADEMAFYELTEKAWDIKPNSMSSADQAARAIEDKMRVLGLPVWCLADVDDYNVFAIVEQYIELVKKEGKAAHQIAVEIGKIARARQNLAENLSRLLTKGKCQKGMLLFLKSFEGGSILALAEEIGAQESLVEDVRKMFGDVKHSWLWDELSGKEQIKQLAVEYSIVKESNSILNGNAHSLETCFKDWKDNLNFTTISWEAAKSACPKTGSLFDYLLKIYQNSEILPEALKTIDAGLKKIRSDVVSVLHNEQSLFTDIYNPYLDGFDDKEIAAIKSRLKNGMFSLSRTECNGLVKSTTEEFRKEQKKTQLFSYWEEKTGSKSPRDWSKKEELPVLCLVKTNDFDKAKKTFDILNRSFLTEIEINNAFDYLTHVTRYRLKSEQNSY